MFHFCAEGLDFRGVRIGIVTVCGQFGCALPAPRHLHYAAAAVFSGREPAGAVRGYDESVMCVGVQVADGREHFPHDRGGGGVPRFVDGQQRVGFYPAEILRVEYEM